MIRTTLLVSLLAAGCAADPLDAHITFTMTNVSEAGDLVDSDGVEHDIAFAPGLIIVHDESFVLFTEGEASPWPGLEPMTEDGNNGPLIRELQDLPEVHSIDSYARQDEDYNDTPLHPGEQVQHTVIAPPGSSLTFVSMYGQSNDIFVATAAPVALFDTDEQPVLDPIALGLFDGGTEVNQEPGVGADQAPRQALSDTGEDEDGVVTAVDGADAAGYTYPAVNAMVELARTAELLPAEEE